MGSWLALVALAFVVAACAAPRGHRERSAAPEPADAAAPIAREAPPDAAAPTILLLGDSHTYGAFGQRLHERLAAMGGHAVVSEAAGGATTDTYLEERPEALVGYRVRETARGERAPRELVSRLRAPIEPLEALLARYDPEIVVVALGTNRPRAPVAESCSAFLERVVRGRPRRVFWIGPPAVGGDRSAAIVATLRAAVEKVPGATFIDGSAFNASTPLPPDNPHFGPLEARRWADAVFAQMEPRMAGDARR